MRLGELVNGMAVQATGGSADLEITELVEDSRHARGGCLFVARAGSKSDGRRFIADAILRGAVAVLSDDPASVPPSVAALICSDVQAASARLAERFFGRPTRELTVVGITGTNGKTTTAYLVRHLLNHGGMRCGLIGTVQIDDGALVRTAELTTPPAIDLSRLMRSMVANGCRACVMEASSHALHQKRTAGLEFRIGVFTNLTGDHLDYHGTMEAYLDAKAILLESLPADGVAVVNVDDAAGESLGRRTAAAVMTCSVRHRNALCHARVGRQLLTCVEASFHGPWGSFDCRLPLLGRHNAANALEAVAVGHALGLDRETLREGIATCAAPPGRLEPVTKAEHDFAVLVDYAHTDDALENVLRSLRPILPSGAKLRVVFGCGGDRDRTKRPRMARAACAHADDVIITSDNPRTEDPQSIIDEICAGVPSEWSDRALRIADRTRAIYAAVDRAEAGDILLIAGKGHEDYQIVGTTRHPFDDRRIAAAALSRRFMKAIVT
jgi:UDP-N-acetylmuramoyl-L-alanyl-D-glutamate--2,6-diaminopimelate ligase